MAQWIAGISIGHNAGVCLLKDGEIVFSVEEERLSRFKHEGGPLLSMMKILDYTDKIDYLIVAGLTVGGDEVASKQHTTFEYTREPIYQGFARRLGLIKQMAKGTSTSDRHPQVINMFQNHHAQHAAIGFFNSGFESAATVVIDSCGSSVQYGNDETTDLYFEVESIFDCSYSKTMYPLYKKMGTNNGPSIYSIDKGTETIGDASGGIGKVWDCITNYCGFHYNDSGKTMGLSAFGSPNENIPPLFNGITSNKDLFLNKYFVRQGSESTVNISKQEYTFLDDVSWESELTLSQNRRDMAYAVQVETQEQALQLILKASEISGNKNVVLTGGYALNCVSNYNYLDTLNKYGINLYVEPNSSDAGTATGAALTFYYHITKNTTVRKRNDNLFLGPKYDYSFEEISEKCDGEISIVGTKDVAKLIEEGNIVSIFQGRSEAGPRALGNRSIVFNPTIVNGKDLVNRVKGREYFRPFAGSVLKEHAHEWFDMKGLEESPSMMYAVDLKEGKADLVPSICHIDNTCRIQTVTEEKNRNFYGLIEEFYKLTNVPILFNTSFNLGGEPLVETIDDALLTLANSEIEYCWMPEINSLIRLHNEGVKI